MKFFLSNFFVGGLLKNDERSWKEAAKLFSVFFIIIFVINFQYLNINSVSFKNDVHALQSINQAYVSAFCGEISKLSPLQMAHIDYSKPINSLIFNNASEHRAYCSNLTYLRVNEPSLSQVYTFLFKAFPSISFKEINNIFVFFKFFIVCLFSFLLFRVGLSPCYVFLFNIFSCFLIYSASLKSTFFSVYSFFIPAYLILVSLSIFYLYFLKKYHYKFIPFGFLIGAYAAFYMNFRTSYFIVILYSIFLLTFFIYLYIRQELGSKLKSLLFTFLCLGVIYGGFQAYMHTFIGPLIIESNAHESARNYLYHSVAHPLVLALGLTTSDLAKREGIEWDDGVGTFLAQKIDPSSSYLNKNYEKALFVYYFKLWIYHPEEMFDIYKRKFMDYKTLKFARSMKSERMTSFNAPFLGLIALFTYLVNTSWKAWAVLLLSFSMLAVFHRRMHTVGLFLALTIVGTCLLLLLESVIIIHFFTISHCTVVNLLFFMVVFYYVQMAVSYFQKHQVFHNLKIRYLSKQPSIS